MKAAKKKSRLYCYAKDRRVVRIPLPETDAEFAILTEWWFGVALSVRSLWTDQYEIEQDFQVFERGNDYDGPRVLWNWVFAPILCGGTARTSYGQFRVTGHRHKKRLEKWVTNRRNGVSYVRRPFQRLAAQIGARRELADSR